ncbi:MAG: hypothetical protein O2913_00800 [Chloroflexi bacterium]|nr:hypothetical protein [Chloroflexota bacterium]
MGRRIGFGLILALLVALCVGCSSAAESPIQDSLVQPTQTLADLGSTPIESAAEPSPSSLASGPPTSVRADATRPADRRQPTLDCTPHSFPQRTQLSLTVDPKDDNKIYIGVEQEGFFKTADGGNTWQKAVTGLKAWGSSDGSGPCYEEFYSTIINPDESGHICIAMAGGPGTVSIENTSAGNNGVYCSADGAESWNQRVGPHMNTAVYTISADPGNFDVMYAGVNGGSCSNLPPVCAPDTYFNNVGSIYKTTDGGQTWSELNSLAARDVRVISLHVHPLNPDLIFAATFSKVTVLGGGAGDFDASTQLGLIRSEDGGKTWTGSVDGMNPSPREQALLGFEISPRNQSRLYVTASSNRSYWSSDSGRTFHPSPRMTAFAFDPFDAAGLHMLGSNGESIQESNDGGDTWSVVSATPGFISFERGVPTALVWSQNDPDTVFLAGPYASVHVSRDGGTTWSQLLSAELLPE